MRDCRDIELLMAPFVDGEVAGPERAAVADHLDRCRCCRDLASAERAARDVIAARRPDLRGAAPEGLHARCAAQAAWNRHSRRVIPAVRQWLPLSVAATVLLAVTAVFSFGLNNKVQALAFQMTLDHVKCSRFANTALPVDSVSAGQQWGAKYGWPLTVPASSPAAGLELRAVRRCGVTDGRVAHLMYEWRGEPLSIFVLPHRPKGVSDEVVERFSHDSVVWSQNGRTYVVLAHAPRRPELDGVVQYVKANVF